MSVYLLTAMYNEWGRKVLQVKYEGNQGWLVDIVLAH